MKASDLISKVVETKNLDETFSLKGTRDFEKHEGDVRAVGGGNAPARRPRTKASINNSYT